MLAMYPKLEWLVNHILSFSQSAHTMLGTYIDSVGLAQAHPNQDVIIYNIKDIEIVLHK